MNKAGRLKQVNTWLFIFLVYQAITGILMATIGGEVLEAAHPIGGILLVVLACIHIGLNWGWVRSAFAKKR